MLNTTKLLARTWIDAKGSSMLITLFAFHAPQGIRCKTGDGSLRSGEITRRQATEPNRIGLLICIACGTSNLK
ncbi:hypothetical protein BDV25DRAFT_95850 [Aspergillus avenaceus]|uniref:Uncharacterized protein n=1 Tax=Aspergillus avenaceus TaxID=36643 RepID=A0A5N6TDR2_ASPAV|nr:hypothetical protein BDV25DRAFT_95850 [Aspergillus avenaceus]